MADKFVAAFAAQYLEALRLARPSSEGLSQLLLDFASLKAALLAIPTVGASIAELGACALVPLLLACLSGFRCSRCS